MSSQVKMLDKYQMNIGIKKTWALGYCWENVTENKIIFEIVKYNYYENPKKKVFHIHEFFFFFW